MAVRGGTRVLFLRLVLTVILFFGLVSCRGAESQDKAGDAVLAKIGYPVTTLINGQIGQILERTNILELSGVEADVFQFTHGPPSNEAMAAGEINVQFTSEAPGVSSIAQGLEAALVFTLGESRDAVLVPKDSDIRDLNDLRGRTIGAPVGTTPYVHLIQSLVKSDLVPNQDVTVQDIAPEELAAALAEGSVDAVAYNEPLPTRLESTIGAHVVQEHSFLYVALMREDFINNHREEAVRVLAAIARAVVFMVENKSLVDGWFSDVSEAEVEVIRKASLHSPVYSQTEGIEDVDLGLSPGDISRLEADAALLKEYDLVDSLPSIPDHVNTELWEEARQLLSEEEFSFDDVEVTS